MRRLIATIAAVGVLAIVPATAATAGNGPECWGWDAELEQSIPLPENCPDEFPWLTTTTAAPTTVPPATTPTTVAATTTTAPAADTTVATTSTTAVPFDAEQTGTTTPSTTATTVDTSSTTVLPGLEIFTTTTAPTADTTVMTELPRTGVDTPWLILAGLSLLGVGVLVVLLAVSEREGGR